MDHFFPEKLLDQIFWDQPLLATTTNQSNFIMNEQSCPSINQSAFVQYNRDQPISNFGEESSLQGSNSKTMNKRMIEFLRKSCSVKRNKVAEYERERGFRHMISERMRRQRLRQYCLDLHSVLPQGTKTDNNSVVQMAAKEIERLQGCREELQRKNDVLEANVESNKVNGSKFCHLRVPYPTCGIDSIVETLKCLKDLGVDTRSIKSIFSHQELFAVLETENKIASTDVERAVQRALDELEWKLGSFASEASNKQILEYEDFGQI